MQDLTKPIQHFVAQLLPIFKTRTKIATQMHKLEVLVLLVLDVPNWVIPPQLSKI
jgi:hypothetical protein